MARNLTDQVRNIAQVATAVANGDLTQTITVDARGEILELKQTLNRMVAQLSSFAAEVTCVAHEVGTEGKLGGQAEVEGVSGTWRRLTEDVNQLAGNLTTQVRAIAEVSTAVTQLFTVLYAIVDPREPAVAWASAGHLPPLLRIAGGETTVIERGDGLIGLEQVEYTDIRRELGPGGLLVLYTDGLVERRGESLDQGLARLERAAASGPADPQRLCNHLLDRLLPEEGSHDDVTAVVVKVG